MTDPNQEDALFEDVETQCRFMIRAVEDYGIFMLSPAGIVRTWNRGAEVITGYTEGEILGRHFRLFYRTEDEAAGLPGRLLDEAIRQGKAPHEGWRVRKDGSRFWVAS